MILTQSRKGAKKREMNRKKSQILEKQGVLPGFFCSGPLRLCDFA